MWIQNFITGTKPGGYLPSPGYLSAFLHQKKETTGQTSKHQDSFKKASDIESTPTVSSNTDTASTSNAASDPGTTTISDTAAEPGTPTVSGTDAATVSITLQEAIIWSEILGEPTAKKRRRRRTGYIYEN